MKLPKTVYVRIDGDKGEEYMLATESPDGEDGDLIGVYRLVETKKMKIAASLV